MHLNGFPKYFIRGDERRAVYYTADARDLTKMGWKPEKAKEDTASQKKEGKPRAESAPKQETESFILEGGTEDEVEGGDPDFDFMTKNELLKFAEEHNIDVKPTMNKPEIVEAIRAEHG